LGLPHALCVFRKTCGEVLILEHNGDLFAYISSLLSDQPFLVALFALCSQNAFAGLLLAASAAQAQRAWESEISSRRTPEHEHKDEKGVHCGHPHSGIGRVDARHFA
jgi:hypothetical protein